MNTRMIEVKVWEKGDRVMTPAGIGTVITTETFTNEYEYLNRFTDVLLDHTDKSHLFDPELLVSLDEWQASQNPTH